MADSPRALEPGETIERVWEMRYGYDWALWGFQPCGCTAEQHIDDPADTTFVLPSLPPCQHGNTLYDVRWRVTMTNTGGNDGA